MISNGKYRLKQIYPIQAWEHGKHMGQMVLPEKNAKTPTHQQVYSAVREGILFGDYAPGQALTIQGLQDTIGAGMTPVREALRRLTAEGAVQMLGNRRICVPVIGSQEVEELFFIRKMLEPELVRRAAQNISTQEIDALDAIDAELNREINAGNVKGYLQLNYAFHKRLYQNAQAPVIADTVDRLWLRFGPSQRQNCAELGRADLPDCHAQITAALREKDIFAAIQATGDDVMQGMNLFMRSRSSVDAR